MKYYFLQHTSTSGFPPEKPERHTSLNDAKEAFLKVASELAQVEQRHSATVHVAPSRYEISEHPDYFLELGPRGGVKCVKA